MIGCGAGGNGRKARFILDEWDIAHSRLRSLSAPEIKAFWNGYEARRGAQIVYGSLWSRWRHVSHDLVISLYLTNRSVGLFVRGPRGEPYLATRHRLSSHEPELGQALGAGLSAHAGCCHLTNLPLGVIDPSCWPRAHDWLEDREEFYHRVLSDIVVRGGSTADCPRHDEPR